MKRVLMLAENWPPRVGGIEHYLSGMARALVVAGNKVTVVAPMLDEKVEEQAAETDGLRVIRRRFFWRWMWPKWLLLWCYLYRLQKTERFEVLICGKVLFEGLLGSYLKRFFNIRLIVCTYAMEIAAWEQRTGTRRKMQNVLRVADQVLYINDVTRDKLLELGAKDERLEALYPALNQKDTGRSEKNEISKTLQRFSVRTPYILSVARLVERKGIDVLIRAFADLDQVAFGNVQLVIVGDGPMLDELKMIAREEMIETSVLFLTEVDDSELRDLYARAEFFALTPYDVEGDIEGFGIVYLEAGARELAVLGTKTGGVIGAVADGESGILVTPDSVEKTQAGLMKLLQDDTLRQRLGTNGKQRVHDHFLWEKRVKQLKRIVG